MAGSLTQEEIVLKLLQNDSSREWAVGKVGWDPESYESVCKWDGIQCGAHDQLEKIILPEEYFEATIPSEFGLLNGLKQLSLARNIGIVGTLPPEVSALESLEVLDISSTSVQGTMPIFSSKVLKEFNCSDTRLGGTIPFLFGISKDDMLMFDASKNSFSGTIPKSLGNIRNMIYMDLSMNKFVGVLPEEMGNLKSLEGLFVNDNQLLGRIPPGLSHAERLEQLFLFNNSFSGTIPVALGDLSMLKNLFVDGNRFTGTIPEEVCALNLNSDWFSGHANTSGRDGCNSVACPVGFKAGHQGVYPCYECTHAFMNPYLGSNECVDIDQRDILKDMYNEMDGDNWVDSKSWQQMSSAEWPESMEECNLEGITCNSAKHIVSISLSNRRLKGRIPSSIGFMRTLSSLDLSLNSITGYIPSDLRWAPLEQMDISGNKLEGFVPPTLCEKEYINDNGYNGRFSCNAIVCPGGTYNPIGRENPKEDKHEFKCMPCFDVDQSSLLGQKSCINKAEATLSLSSDQKSDDHTSILYEVAIPISIAFVFIVSLFLYKKYDEHKRRTQTQYYCNSNGVKTKSIFAMGKSPPSIFGDTQSNVRKRNGLNSLSFDVSTDRQKDAEVWLDVPRGQIT